MIVLPKRGNITNIFMKGKGLGSSKDKQVTPVLARRDDGGAEQRVDEAQVIPAEEQGGAEEQDDNLQLATNMTEPQLATALTQEQQKDYLIKENEKIKNEIENLQQQIIRIQLDEEYIQAIKLYKMDKSYKSLVELPIRQIRNLRNKIIEKQMKIEENIETIQNLF